MQLSSRHPFRRPCRPIEHGGASSCMPDAPMTEARARALWARPGRPLLLLLAQLLLIAAFAATWWSVRTGGRAGDSLRRLVPAAWTSGGGAGADAAGPLAGSLFPHTSNLTEWAAEPEGSAFLAPHSRCLLDPRGAVQLRQWRGNASTAFLFDTATMPGVDEACGHCPEAERHKDEQRNPVPACCGVCVFAFRKCEDFYPGENRPRNVLNYLLSAGFGLQDMSPCELFARIRGRTLWVMGDSQTWNVYYALECFMREFAPDLVRRPPLESTEENARLLTVRSPAPFPPLCLELVLDTRVCVVRVDAIKNMRELVFPILQAHSRNFTRDLVVFNFGLHYAMPGKDGKPANASVLYQGLLALAQWRKQQLGRLPQMVWMDTPVQHFSTYDGTWPGGQKPYNCSPLQAYIQGDPLVRAGGGFNVPLAPLIPHIADAHLRTWDASVPLWRTHWKDECSHWCHPSAYQLWLLLLNDVLRDNRLGNAVYTPERQ